MSWSKHIYSFIYKRKEKFDYVDFVSKEIEDADHWSDYLWGQELALWDELGAPKNMGQLAEYKLLTLLEKLKIKSAYKYKDQIGWY